MQWKCRMLFFMQTLFFPFYSQGQNENMGKKIIKIDLASPIYSSLSNGIAGSIFFDYNLKNHHGIQVQLFSYSFDEKNSKFKSFQFIPQYKYSFNKNYKGLYTGVYLKYKYFYEKEIIQIPKILRLEFSQQSFNLGLILGCQIYLGSQKHFTVDILSGIGYGRIYSTNYIVKETEYIFSKDGPDGILAINLGYCFGY